MAAPLRRQPDPHRHPQPLLPHRRQRRALRHARRSAATSCRVLDLRTTGMEFASEMVIRASKEKLDIRRVPDRVPPARRRVEALELPRRLAPPALPAGPQPDAPVHPARRGDGRPRRARSRCRRAAQIDIFGRSVGPAHDDRRLPAARSSAPGRLARPVRARLRQVLHGRARPVVRPHARPLQARARPAARRRASRSPASPRRRHRRRVDRPRLRRPVRAAPGGRSPRR